MDSSPAVEEAGGLTPCFAGAAASARPRAGRCEGSPGDRDPLFLCGWAVGRTHAFLPVGPRGRSATDRTIRHAWLKPLLRQHRRSTRSRRSSASLGPPARPGSRQCRCRCTSFADEALDPGDAVVGLVDARHRPAPWVDPQGLHDRRMREVDLDPWRGGTAPAVGDIQLLGGREPLAPSAPAGRDRAVEGMGGHVAVRCTSLLHQDRGCGRRGAGREGLPVEVREQVAQGRRVPGPDSDLVGRRPRPVLRVDARPRVYQRTHSIHAPAAVLCESPSGVLPYSLLAFGSAPAARRARAAVSLLQPAASISGGQRPARSERPSRASSASNFSWKRSGRTGRRSAGGAPRPRPPTRGLALREARGACRRRK